MAGFHRAAARGLHPVRAWMTQRQRLEVPVHAFPISLQRKAGRVLAGCPGPYLDWKRSRELHPQAEDLTPTSKPSGHSKRSPPCPQESRTRRTTMKDRPEVSEPQPDNPGDPETARESSGAVPCQEIERYICLFVPFTTTGVIVMVLYHVINPVGSPLDTIGSIILNMWRAVGTGIALTVTVILIPKTVRFVSRSLRQLPFKSPERNPRK